MSLARAGSIPAFGTIKTPTKKTGITKETKKQTEPKIVKEGKNRMNNAQLLSEALNDLYRDQKMNKEQASEYSKLKATLLRFVPIATMFDSLSSEDERKIMIDALSYDM